MDTNEEANGSVRVHSKAFTGQVAKDHARQHVGDNYTYNSCTRYISRKVPLVVINLSSDSNTYAGSRSASLGGYFSRKKHSKELLKAAELGATQRVRMLLARGADIDCKETGDLHRGWTALHYAANGGFVNVVKLLIDHGCSLSASGDDLYTALQLSLLAKHGAAAKAIAQSDGIDTKLELRIGLVLQIAASNGHGEVVQSLLRANKDPKVYRWQLLWACREGLTDLIRELLAVPSIIDEPCNNNTCALIVAITSGHTTVVQMLIDSATLRTNNGDHMCDHYRTALQFAMHERSLDVKRTLLSAPIVDKEFRDDNGDTAFHRAVKFRQFNTTKLLIAHECDLNSQNKYGHTPLHLALVPGFDNRSAVDTPSDVEMTKILVKAGAMVTIADNKGLTPLHLAAGHLTAKHLPIVLTKTTKADLTIQDSEGSTPLDLALFCGRVESIPRLVKAGADLVGSTHRVTSAILANNCPYKIHLLQPHEQQQVIEYLEREIQKL